MLSFVSSYMHSNKCTFILLFLEDTKGEEGEEDEDDLEDIAATQKIS